MNLKKSIGSIASAIVLLGGALTAHAVPAKQGPIPYKMPDGSIVEILLHGDERHSYASTTDGYVVKSDSDNVLRYMVPRDGRLVMSDVRVTNIADRTAEANALLAGYDKAEALNILEAQRVSSQAFKAPTGPSRAGTNEVIASFPTKGEQKILVVLAEYSDVKFSTPDPHTAFDNLMNQQNYSEGGATGSAFDFFTASSNGQFIPQFDVYGPVTLPNTRAYYGAHTSSGGNDIRAAEMIRDACQLLDDEVDFSQYDANKDGYIDNVYVFYAGNGEADTQIEEAIWPHAWYVYSGGGLFLRLDGKILDHYACSGELSRSWTRGDVLTGIGTFVHEFSHVMGLPDLYSTNYTGAFTPGAWTVMDQGSYNNEQRTPPTHSAYERFVFGWINPEILNEPANITLKPITEDYNSAYRITTARDAEYYVLENRQQTAWNKYIPGHGMLIWHIDYNSSVWRYNTVNDDANHQRIDIEEADGTQTENSRANDAFPGGSKATEFTDDSNPSMVTWSNVRLDKPVTDIRESNNKIFFQFKGGVFDDAPLLTLQSPTELTAETATLNWTAVNGVTEYFVTVETTDGTKIVNRAKVSGTTSYKVTGLTFQTKYIYSVIYRSGDFYAGKTSEFTTPFGSVNYHSVNVLGATDVTSTSFTANWEPLEGAESYSVTVYNSTTIPSQSSTLDFTDKAITDGWKTDSKTFATITGYFGESSPSLSLSTDNNYIQTPLTDQPIATLSFGARGRQNGNSTLDICVPDGEGGWTVVTSVKPATSTWQTYSLDASTFGYNANQLRIVHKKGTMSNIVIDDVKITTQEGREYTPMTGKTDMSAGSATSLNVNGLNAGTLYFYSVAAHQGNLVSLDSRKVAVTTSGTSGIEDVADDSAETACRMTADGIVVTTSYEAKVEIYTVTGMLIVSDVKNAGTTEYAVDGLGIYVVKVGNNVYKLVR